MFTLFGKLKYLYKRPRLAPHLGYKINTNRFAPNACLSKRSLEKGAMIAEVLSSYYPERKTDVKRLVGRATGCSLSKR